MFLFISKDVGVGLMVGLFFSVLFAIIRFLNTKEDRKIRKKQRLVEKESDDLNDKIASLKSLRNKNILTEEEYNEKAKNLKNKKQEFELRLSTDYQKLKSLLEDGILTEQEFKNKIEIIRRSNIDNVNHNKEVYTKETKVINTNKSKTRLRYSLIVYLIISVIVAIFLIVINQ